MSIHFRLANLTDIDDIWLILQQAIHRRKMDGSDQWQDGYPNPEIIKRDILKNGGYVLQNENIIIGYFAVFENDEPEYKNIEGKWLSNEDFIVVHRIAIKNEYLGKGFAKQIFRILEKLASDKKISSIKVDTNHDNYGMLNLLNFFGYSYCGTVHFRGAPRRAYEKILNFIV